MIIIGGDIREKGVPFARTAYNLRQLQCGAPTLFVWGNHDKEERTLELKRLLTSYHIEILAGNTYCWKLLDQELRIAGFDETTRGADSSWTKAEILVSHYPVTALEASTRGEAHFMLTGHSHGGQIRLGPWDCALRRLETGRTLTLSGKQWIWNDNFCASLWRKGRSSFYYISTGRALK